MLVSDKIKKEGKKEKRHAKIKIQSGVAIVTIGGSIQTFGNRMRTKRSIIYFDSSLQGSNLPGCKNFHRYDRVQTHVQLRDTWYIDVRKCRP